MAEVSIQLSRGRERRTRLVYCSDGVAEEYISDSDSEPFPDASELLDFNDDVDSTGNKVSTSEMSWPSWFRYYATSIAFGLLSSVDYCGEKLAWGLGITYPKYQYAIDEYHRIKKEEAELNKELAEEEEAYQRQSQPQLKVDTSVGKRPIVTSSSQSKQTPTQPLVVISAPSAKKRLDYHENITKEDVSSVTKKKPVLEMEEGDISREVTEKETTEKASDIHSAGEVAKEVDKRVKNDGAVQDTEFHTETEILDQEGHEKVEILNGNGEELNSVD